MTKAPGAIRHTSAIPANVSAVAVVAELSTVNAIHRLRSIQGIVGLRERYGAARLDAACARALAVGDPRYRTIKNILAAGAEYDGQDSTESAALPPALLRGPQAFGA